MMTLTERIKEEARRLGFSHTGISRAEPLEKEGEHLRGWLARGYHAGMGWMERREAERIDVTKVLPGARSVVSVAINYYTPHRHSEEGGKISRYAWGDDYHEILLEKLEHLATWMGEAVPGSRSLAYVDTGPVMEKAWAERGGIGWCGKNGNLITQDAGSWVFLGELLTTAELSPDSPATDHCGSCTLCIEACPTRAIVSPGVIDSSLCISYLTIEHRGEFAEGEAERIGSWIYGCDVCQDVCPWNLRFATPSPEPRFQPREGMAEPDLAEWRGISEEAWRTLSSGSAMRRVKWGDLLRNIRAVLRNIGRGE
jgi:epoxyqueuosine reductase